MSDDLVTWLRAQLDEEERLAKAADDAVVDFVGEETKDNGEPGAGKHIRRWLPSRVLAEIAAQRRILDLHPHQRFVEPLSAGSLFEDDHRAAFPEEPRYIGCQRCNWDWRFEEVFPSWWCDTVCLLAEPYADRPGYQEAWRPVPAGNAG